MRISKHIQRYLCYYITFYIYTLYLDLKHRYCFTPLLVCIFVTILYHYLFVYSLLFYAITCFYIHYCFIPLLVCIFVTDLYHYLFLYSLLFYTITCLYIRYCFIALLDCIFVTDLYHYLFVYSLLLYSITCLYIRYSFILLLVCIFILFGTQTSINETCMQLSTTLH